jgi:hypothetical protein
MLLLAAAACGAMAALALPNTTITSAQIVAAGALDVPDTGRSSGDGFADVSKLPAFCRVQGVIQPSADSRIGFETWMPAAGWNRRYLGVGNGGYGGAINYARLADALAAGYATSSTDTGHRGSADDEASWSTGHPEKRRDYDERAIHETAETSKAIIAAFYGQRAAHSYFSSCSNGGRQGVIEAQRYPGDYDGVLAGAPALFLGWYVKAGPDMTTFRDRGGKLIIFHGGADAPELNVNFYTRVIAAMGEKAANDFSRLYIVPKMGHCGGGPEPNDFGQTVRPGADAKHSMLAALEAWVEEGIAPSAIVATKYGTDAIPSSGIEKTRPLCPWPAEAEYVGRGDINDAASYVCRDAKK